ncbi:MAG: hypothetical protein LBU14_02850 [Candidatus Peribacteria bacterium]|jgi:hypothetical protein|nr:hypothetical protein [Candidatus Peribacteria bacterium]
METCDDLVKPDFSIFEFYKMRSRINLIIYNIENNIPYLSDREISI